MFVNKKDSLIYDVIVSLLILYLSFICALFTRVVLSICVKTPAWYQEGGNLTTLFGFTYPLFGFLMMITTFFATYFIFRYITKKRVFKTEKTTDKNKLVIKCIVIIVIFTVIKFSGLYTEVDLFLTYWFCYITGIVDGSFVTPETNLGATYLVLYVIMFIESLILYFAMYYGKKSGEKKGLAARQLSRQKLVEEQPSV